MLVAMSDPKRVPGRHKFWLALECAGLFLGVPAAVAMRWLPVPFIPVLLVMTAACWLALEYQHRVPVRTLLKPKVSGREWTRVLVIYLVALPCLAGLLWLIEPRLMFLLLRKHPGIWLLIMVAYPVLSVFPQELIYRAFFFERYRPLFGRELGMIAASAAVFAFGHIIFHHWISVVLTLAGGWLFATTYRRTSSLLLVCAEHALYGCAIFTIGFGEYFFDRLPWLFR